MIKTLSGHISSVRCLALSPKPDAADQILFSAGGRAQMKAWKMAAKSPDCLCLEFEDLANFMLCSLRQKKRAQLFDPETRFMAVTAFSVSCHDLHLHFIAAACSDAYIRSDACFSVVLWLYSCCIALSK